MRYIVRTVSWDKKRLANVAKLKEQIPHLEIHVDQIHDGYKSFFEVCKLINTTGAVILEDDIAICNDFCLEIENIIQEKGIDKVYNFFQSPKTYFKTSYVGGSSFLWMQCIYLPAMLPLKIVSYHDEFKEREPERWTGMATDRLIGYCLKKEKIKYWRIRPCLVQHLDFESVIKSGRRPTNRQSPYYIEILKKEGINYDDLQIAK